MEDKFSVLMSVYKNDRPEDLSEAVESIYSRQLVQPNEIILIVDGPVPEELDMQIGRLQQNIPCLRVHKLSENKGLGNALQIGTELCSNDIIARMDSDDIALPERFREQITFLHNNPLVDIVGGQINEFIGTTDNIVGKREVPLSHLKLARYARSRCPFNHMTVMFRKKAVMNAGNYIPWHFNEDYYLWIRMLEHSAVFANLSQTLVNVRVNSAMYARRGGWKYFKSEKRIQDYMYRHRLIGFPQYFINVLIRFAVQVAMPNSVRQLVFQKIIRK